MPMLKLRAACKDYIWGGHRLRSDYSIDSDLQPLAEAWVLSCHPDGLSVIAEGPAAGQPLAAWLAAHPAAAGSRAGGFASFPVLIKLIDAQKDLSIQVHPSDAYARAHGQPSGKTELWYILDARPGASLCHGFTHAITREEFARRIADNTLPEVLRRVPVRPGDVFYIPAGTIHSIGAGIVLAEVQQSSNITYRVYDYGRLGADGKPRALHIPEALAVTDTAPAPTGLDHGGHLARCPYFTVDVFTGDFAGNADAGSFAALLALDGAGVLACGGEEMPLRKGECVFLPAASGAYAVRGAVKTLVTSV